MTSLIEQCRQLMLTGASVDDLLAVMRRAGQSRTDSIGLLIELTGMSLREAKAVVHKSSAWEDLREDAEAIHERLENAGEQSKDKPTG
jgi:ribosomal protein L7/L12